MNRLAQESSPYLRGRDVLATRTLLGGARLDTTRFGAALGATPPILHTRHVIDLRDFS